MSFNTLKDKEESCHFLWKNTVFKLLKKLEFVKFIQRLKFKMFL